MTGKRSPAKEQTAQQRQRKLAAALRTNLRRRKEHARDDPTEQTKTTLSPIDPASGEPYPVTSPKK
jgi:hypothetical protein